MGSKSVLCDLASALCLCSHPLGVMASASASSSRVESIARDMGSTNEDGPTTFEEATLASEKLVIKSRERHFHFDKELDTVSWKDLSMRVPEGQSHGMKYKRFIDVIHTDIPVNSLSPMAGASDGPVEQRRSTRFRSLAHE